MASKTGLLDIPAEVWLEQSFDTNEDEELQTAFANLTQTCRQAYLTFTPLLYRHMQFQFYQSYYPTPGSLVKLSLFMRSLNETPSIGQHVRDLVLQFSDMNPGFDPQPEVDEGLRGLDSELSKTLPTSMTDLPKLSEVLPDGISTQFPTRRTNLLYACLKRLQRLRTLDLGETLNPCLVPITVPSLSSLTLRGRLPCSSALRKILAMESLQELSVNIWGENTSDNLSGIPQRRHRMKSLSVTIDRAGPVDLAASFIKCFRSVENLSLKGMGVTITEDSLGYLSDAIPSSVKELDMDFPRYVFAALVDRECTVSLRRLKHLHRICIQPELLLGYEPCKHTRSASLATFDSLHPKSLAEGLLPKSLRKVWFYNSYSHWTRNGDDFYVHFLKALIANPSALPELQEFGLQGKRNDLTRCLTCQDWYFHPSADQDAASLTEHEWDRICRLAVVLGIDLEWDEVPLTAVPNDGIGITLKRLNRVNKARSWYVPDEDEDIGLFELFIELGDDIPAEDESSYDEDEESGRDDNDFLTVEDSPTIQDPLPQQIEIQNNDGAQEAVAVEVGGA